MGKTRLTALPKMYKTPPVPHKDAMMVAAPVTGHFVPVSYGLAGKAVLGCRLPPRGRFVLDATGEKPTATAKRLAYNKRVNLIL
jgi:hypothetical protein